MTFSRMSRLGALVVGALALGASPAFAHDCVNLSKNGSSPTVIIGTGCGAGGSDTLTVKQGVQSRIDKFGLDANGEPNFNFHGPLGLDFNCDGTADVVTYEPGQGTDGVIPAAEKTGGQNRANCKGLMNFESAAVNGCL